MRERATHDLQRVGKGDAIRIVRLRARVEGHFVHEGAQREVREQNDPGLVFDQRGGLAPQHARCLEDGGHDSIARRRGRGRRERALDHAYRVQAVPGRRAAELTARRAVVEALEFG